MENQRPTRGQASARQPQRLLVYGLLRQGLAMAGLMAGAKLLGLRQVPGFDLYNLGRYPGVASGEGTLVAELYEMPADCSWAELDEAEGVDEAPPLYRRETVALEDGPAQIYVYAQPLGDAEQIHTGDWLNR